MDTITLGGARVSRFILGSNPFSGFSHRGSDTDLRMRRYYTVARIKDTLRAAQGLGINTLIARADHHVMRMLLEYADEGGSLQWFAQTCPELGTPEQSIGNAAEMRARACYLHGGVMDFLLAQNRMAEVPPLIEMIRGKGMLAGIAGHNPGVFRWAEEARLNVDFYMCSYYNSAHRDERAEHVSGRPEWFLEEDRAAMTALIASLSKPVIHYKILAAGRNDPREAFAYAAKHMRSTDAVCVGVFHEGKAGMLEEDVRMFEQATKGRW
jgi:hypothetical protein